MRIGHHQFDRGLFLAPMEDVSDAPFRILCRRLGADVVYTEFVKSDDLVRGLRGAVRKMRFTAEERPVGIQLYGGDDAILAEAAQRAEELQPDLIDLNCGCWVPDVVRHGAGAALLLDLDRLEHVAASVVRAVRVPVTLKTRLGWDAANIRIVDVARRCEAAGIKALTVHCRTRDQGHSGPPDYDWIPRVKAAVSIPVIVNGGVESPAEARRVFETTGCDAVMIGRAAVRNPWIFAHARRLIASGETLPPPSPAERIAVFQQHLELAVAHLGASDAVRELRRHYAVVLHGMPDVGLVRDALRRATTPAAILEELSRHCDLFAPVQSSVATAAAMDRARAVAGG
jgi:tRNA-dihydrouridine synthase B